MKKIIIALLSIFMVVSCSKERGNMIVKGKIKGLKKGTLYLQKLKDTTIVSVDSIQLFNEDTFILSDNVDSPVMYYLSLGNKIKKKELMFFGEKGEITINDNVEEFGFKPQIKGSKNQEIMDDFNRINKKFKDKNLELLAKGLNARVKKDSTTILKIEKEYKKLIRRKYLFATNFAISNSDYEVAPYIALSELVNANIYLLDTINKSLSNKVKNSIYGKKLNKSIINIKAKEK